MRSPSAASRSRTRGWRTATGPMPVMISRSGRWPWRTTRCWPVSVLRSVCFARNSATSASTAWVSNARAPLRRISVRESVKAPGWASLMTLLSDTAYHSFIGEVEALNTTTIRRLTRSPRHQLLAIAPPARPQTLDEPLGPATPTIIVERPVSGIEIELIGGRRVRFDRDIDAETVRRVVSALDQRLLRQYRLGSAA